MSDAVLQTSLSRAQFFEVIEPLEGRFELHRGVLFAMVGGSEAHALIAANALLALTQLARPRGCRAYGPDFFVNASSNGGDSVLSPDAWVRCGPIDPKSLSADDPIVVVEVLSPSTLAFDRGGKLQAYFGIASLQHVLLIYQHAKRLELWTRQMSSEGAEPSWAVSHHESLDETIEIRALDGTVRLQDFYVDMP